MTLNSSATNTGTTSKTTSKIKFTYNETREFAILEDEIEKLENELKKLNEEMQENWADHIKIKNLTEKHAMLQKELSEKMERWVYLNEKAEQIKSQKEK